MDQSCLAALPADLRFELERAYAKQSRQSAQRPNNVVDQSDLHPLMRIKVCYYEVYLLKTTVILTDRQQIICTT